MSTHKDLPSGSQQWASELDAALKEMKRLQLVVQRLSQNAGIDYANPQRGLNPGDTPSVVNPVRQKLSSLADVATYNVAEGQVLTWSQQGQKWLPVTPLTGGTINVSSLSYSGVVNGYGQVVDGTKYAYTAAEIVGPNGYTEVWSSNANYFGCGNWADGTGYSLIEMSGDGFARPYVSISASDYADSTYASLAVYSYGVRIDGAYFVAQRCSTANRPTGLGTGDQRRGAMVYDTTLNIPIWWNGTTWTNALGTAV